MWIICESSVLTAPITSCYITVSLVLLGFYFEEGMFSLPCQFVCVLARACMYTSNFLLCLDLATTWLSILCVCVWHLETIYMLSLHPLLSVDKITFWFPKSARESHVACSKMYQVMYMHTCACVSCVFVLDITALQTCCLFNQAQWQS